MKWFESFVNVLFWIVTAWLIITSFSIERQEIEIQNGVEVLKTLRNDGLIYQLFVLVSLSLVAFYLNFANISKLKKGSNLFMVVMTSILIFLGLISLYIGLEKMYFGDDYPSLVLSLSIGIAMFYFAVSCAYALVKVWILAEQNRQHLLLVNKQSELTLLRNQLRPHFLFNALNNLMSMVDYQKSPQLSSSFEKLSNLLRYVIEETKYEKVNILSEVDFIRNYCDLQLLRFEKNEVNLLFSVIGDNCEVLIEPGLFIPFVENAFKYGTEPESSSTIEILFDFTSRQQIRFLVKNKKMDNFEKIESTRTGISSTRERLDLVYPDKYSLEIWDEDNFQVELKITVE